MKERAEWRHSVPAKSVLGVLICACLFLLSLPKTIGQTFYGALVGTVTDSTGAVVRIWAQLKNVLWRPMRRVPIGL
jgi:hypothetical protein